MSRWQQWRWQHREAEAFAIILAAVAVVGFVNWVLA